MKNRIKLEALAGMPISDIAVLSVEELAMLIQDADEISTNLKEWRGRLDAALSMRFCERAGELRQANGKDFGAVTFSVDGYSVIADLPKKVTWDNNLLNVAGENIKDAAHYIDIKLTVSEAKFNNAPSSIRDALMVARIVSTSKQTFKIVKKDEVL